MALRWAVHERLLSVARTLAACLCSHACRNEALPTPVEPSATSRAAQRAPDAGLPVPAPPSPPPMPAGAPTIAAVETLIVADCEAIRDALIQKIEASDVTDRDYLLRHTRNATRESEGTPLRIGLWNVEARDDHYRLMLRMGPYPHPVFYAADVRRENGRWLVSSFGQGLIHWKRP